jgi:large subunit ribosomal protein L21
MSYAIIRTGGKQYRVNAGDRLKIEKLNAEVGQEVALSEVLALGEGAELNVAAGALSGVSVSAKVLRHGRGPKIRIQKFKRRKGFDRRQGHRQDFTEVQILAIPGANAQQTPPPAENL